jgi:hypothetical protein
MHLKRAKPFLLFKKDRADVFGVLLIVANYFSLEALFDLI